LINKKTTERERGGIERIGRASHHRLAAIIADHLHVAVNRFQKERR